MTNPPPAPRDPAPDESPGVVPASAAPSGSGPAHPPSPEQPVPTPSFGLPPTQPAPPSYDPTLLPGDGPYAEPEPEPAATGGSTAITVLSVLLGLFVLASITLGGLYVRQGQESTRKSEEIATLEAANAGTLRQLHAAERNLRSADEELADVRTERDAIASCLTAIYAWWDAREAAGGADTPDTEQARLQASRLCRVADEYL